MSPDTAVAFLDGKTLPLKQLKERYHLALSANNNDILKLLYGSKKPLATKEITKALKSSVQSVHDKLSRLIEEDIVLRFRMGREIVYLLSEKGSKKYELCVQNGLIKT